MATPHHVLVFRFSALGDVAMTLPVIKQALLQYPELRITFVSNRSFQALFQGIDRLHFHPADLRKEHRGITGLYRLYKQLKQQYDFDAIADLHQVLRTKALRTFFSFTSVPVAVLDKGREEKKKLTRKENKSLVQLPTSFERYATVFDQLGLPIKLDIKFIPLAKPQSGDHPLDQLKQQGLTIIGVAPFAKHEEKMYPAIKVQELIRQLLQRQKTKIYLFGGGKTEKELLDQWEKELPGTVNLAGRMDLSKELEFISRLDLMISMDSANMHLASLFGIPVVSIWGATHPFAGFYGWGQSQDNAVQVDLFCRPCSVFGNRPCYRGNLECLHSIGVEEVYKKVVRVLDKKVHSS